MTIEIPDDVAKKILAEMNRGLPEGKGLNEKLAVGFVLTAGMKVLQSGGATAIAFLIGEELSLVIQARNAANN